MAMATRALSLSTVLMRTYSAAVAGGGVQRCVSVNSISSGNGGNFFLTSRTIYPCATFATSAANQTGSSKRNPKAAKTTKTPPTTTTTTTTTTTPTTTETTSSSSSTSTTTTTATATAARTPLTKGVSGKVTTKRTSPKLSPPTPLPRPRNPNAPAVTLKRRRRKKANTNTMAQAAKAYARQQRRKAGDKSVRPLTIHEQVLAEMHMEAEGPTIQVTEQELQAAPSSLSFEQLYRRILRTFEEHKLPERLLLFEMLKKCTAQEDWDNFVIIAKVYQSKLLVLNPTQASHLIHLAINQGFLNQICDEIHKNVMFVYPTKAGYHKLIVELMKAGHLDKVWKTLQLMAERDIRPARETFKVLVHHYHATDVDTAMKLFSVCSQLGVRTTSVMAYEMARKLAELERWSDIVEVEKIAKKDNPTHSFRKLMSLLFIKSHVATGDMDGAAALAQHDYHAFLQEDIKDTTTMADAKNTFPFIDELVQLIPQLAASSSSSSSAPKQQQQL